MEAELVPEALTSDERGSVLLPEYDDGGGGFKNNFMCVPLYNQQQFGTACDRKTYLQVACLARGFDEILLAVHCETIEGGYFVILCVSRRRRSSPDREPSFSTNKNTGS